MKQLGAQKGGKSYTQHGGDETEEEKAARLVREAQGQGGGQDEEEGEATGKGGRRRRRNSKHHKGNSWLAHVKATMKDKKNKGKSFKQVLKLAKKTYKKSQSLSGGKGKRKTRGMYGGSGGTSNSTFGANAHAYPI